jgi:hypothetical protein
MRASRPGPTGPGHQTALVRSASGTQDEDGLPTVRNLQ